MVKALVVQGPTLDEAKDAFRKQWGTAETTARKAHQFARKSVKDAWHAGCAFATVKELIPHGQWMPWVEKEGLSISASKRLILLSELEIGQVGLFVTMDAALTFARNARIGNKRLTIGEPDEPGPGVVSNGEAGGYEPASASPKVDAGETLRMRAEDAERRANDAELHNKELQDRAAVVLARDSDDSRAADIWKETETATQATQIARSELARVQDQLSKAMKADKAKDRKLSAIKADLLNGVSVGDVLAKHYGKQAKDGGGNHVNAER